MTSRSKSFQLPVCDACGNKMSLSNDGPEITAIWGTKQLPRDKSAWCWCWCCDKYTTWHFVERHDITETANDSTK